MANTIAYTAVTSTSFKIIAGELRTNAGTKRIYWYLNGEKYGDSVLLTEKGEKNTREFTDLTPGTWYSVYYIVEYSDYEYAEYSDTISVQTAEEEPYVPDTSGMELTVSVDGTDVILKISGFDADYDGGWETSWNVSSSDDVILDDYVISSGDSDRLGTYKKITLSADNGIKAGTKYTAIVYCRYLVGTDWEGIKILAKTFTTDDAPNPDRPAKFTWADGSVVKTAGNPFDITAAEWCDLLDNFKAVLEYKGYAVPSSGTGLAQFYYPSRGDEFAAWIYNQVLYQLYLIEMTDYNPVSSGDSVTAARINDIVELLNSIN